MGKSASGCAGKRLLDLTQTRKSQHRCIELEQEVSFLWRFVQRVPDIALPLSFRLGIDDFDGLLLHLDFLVFEFGHHQTAELDKLARTKICSRTTTDHEVKYAHTRAIPEHMTHSSTRSRLPAQPYRNTCKTNTCSFLTCSE